jgi:hypothetical protein
MHISIIHIIYESGLLITRISQIKFEESSIFKIWKSILILKTSANPTTAKTASFFKSRLTQNITSWANHTRPTKPAFWKLCELSFLAHLYLKVLYAVREILKNLPGVERTYLHQISDIVALCNLCDTSIQRGA